MRPQRIVGCVLPLVFLTVLPSTPVVAGDNPAFTFVLHAKSGHTGNCTDPGQPNCGTIRPTVNVLQNGDYRVFVYVNNIASLAGMQTAFQWDLTWDLLGSSWGCRSGQLTASVPDSTSNGGPTTGTLATVFDCLTGPTLALIGYMDFRVGLSGCLFQVNSAFGSQRAEVVDCQNQSDGFSALTEPLRLGSICVGAGGHDACDPLPGNQPPICNAGGPYVGLVGTPVQFNGSASQDLDGTIVAYAWSFGGSGPTATYTYDRHGIYPVTLTVTDDRGASSACETRVVIGPGAAIDPALASAMAQAGPDDLIPVLAVCVEQVASADLYAMTDGLSREERRRVVLTAKRSVTDAQGPVLAYLEDQAQLGNAREPVSIYSVNSVATRAKASVIVALASMPELDVLYLDKEGVLTIDCATPPDYHICDGTADPCDGDPSSCGHPVRTCINENGQPVTIPVPLSQDPQNPSVSYALQFLGMPEVWSQFRLKGTGSLVLDVDVGIDYCQPSIANRYSFNTCEPSEPNGIDEDQNDFPDDYFGWDTENFPDRDPYTIPPNPPVMCQLIHSGGGDHGTYTAGAAVGDGSEYPGFGSKITGTAPGASLRSWLGLIQSDQLRGDDYALAIGADVVTVQYIIEGQTQSARDAVQTLEDAGILTVAAAGNAYNDPAHPMADVAQVPEAIGVGGVWNADPDPDRCDYTRYHHPSGPVRWPDGTFIKPDLVAPADPVETVAGYWDCHRQICEGPPPGGGNHPRGEFAHQYHGGTSMSAPLVAGMAAIMFERNNELLPAELKAALEATALHLDENGIPNPSAPKNNDYGSGVPRLVEALRSIDLVNTFDRYLELHAVQAGGLPTNWTFHVDDNSPPIVSIVDLTPGGYNPCTPLPNRRLPRAGLRMESPAQFRNVGYVWDEHESYEFRTTFKFDTDPNGARFLGLLLRWDPATGHCVYIRTRQVVPGDPTSTEFVFGHEESSGTGPYLTVPWSSHGFDFQDMTKNYYWRVNDDGQRVSFWVGIVGYGGEREIFSLEPYTTAVPSIDKGMFVQAGAGAIFDHVTVVNFRTGVSVEEPPAASPTLPLSLVVVSPSGMGTSTFEVTKKEGSGYVAVYDVVGREVQRLALPTAAGVHALHWDGERASGARIPSGVYFVRVTTGAETTGRKFVFLR